MRLFGLLCLLLAMAPPGRAQAQQPAVCGDGFVLAVEVRSSSGEAVSGASVVLPDRQRRFITDAEGRFVVDGVCPEPLKISISHLSYGTTTFVREVAADQALVIELDPRPIVLEGLTVSVGTVTQQLERRRQAFGYKSGVFNADDFSGEAPPSDIPAYVAARTGNPLTACDRRETFGERMCYPYHGRKGRVETVCIDGNPSPQGSSSLDQAVQQADIARLEFYPSEGLIKVYTKAYILLASEKPWLLAGPVDRC